MGFRIAALFLVALAVAGAVALVVGLLALFGVDIASTNPHFVVGVSPHLRPAVLLPLVYVVIPGLATAVAAGVFLHARGVIRAGRTTGQARPAA